MSRLLLTAWVAGLLLVSLAEAPVVGPTPAAAAPAAADGCEPFGKDNDVVIAECTRVIQSKIAAGETVTLKFADGARGALVDPSAPAPPPRPAPAPRARPQKLEPEQGDLF